MESHKIHFPNHQPDKLLLTNHVQITKNIQKRPPFAIHKRHPKRFVLGAASDGRPVLTRSVVEKQSWILDPKEP